MSAVNDHEQISCSNTMFGQFMFLFSKSLKTLNNFKIDEAKVCPVLCVSVCLSLASDSTGTQY